MQMGTLGNTGLKVSRLGAGLAEIGEELTMADVERAGRVLNTALDGGICFLDTAAGYLISEELVGRTIAHRRDEYVLATKCGAIGNKGTVKLWNAQAITDNIDRSLRRLRTDRLDLVQLHSCEVEVLKQGEATEALLAAKQAGKTRFVGYSGDNAAALWAVESGLFDTLQTSFSVVDQHARTRLFGPARARGMGIIVKRPIANGAWGASRSPTAELNYEPMRTYGDEYFRRAQVMAQMGGIPDAPDDRFLVALGFVMAHPEIDTAIVGTYNPAHMAANIEMVEGRLPIPGEVVEELHRRFDEAGEEWLQRS